MKRAAAFSRWLGTPIREARALFPFSQDGRQTVIYLIFAGAGPALTLILLRILDQTKAAGQWSIYSMTAEKLGWALLIIVTALGTYVAWRSVKLGRDGLSANAKDDSTAEVADAVAGAAVDKADEIKGNGP